MKSGHSIRSMHKVLSILKSGGGKHMEEILQAISVVGFPIVAYGGMFWYMIKLNDNHKTEIDAMRESLNANTEALRGLKELFTRIISNDN